MFSVSPAHDRQKCFFKSSRIGYENCGKKAFQWAYMIRYSHRGSS